MTTLRPEVDPLKPSLSLLVKLSSIVVHAEELCSPKRHHFDLAAIKTLFDDEEVKQWIKSMGPFAPVKR